MSNEHILQIRCKDCGALFLVDFTKLKTGDSITCPNCRNTGVVEKEASLEVESQTT